MGAVTAEFVPATKHPTVQCPVLPPQFRDVSLDYGIWLGSTNGRISSILGQPSRTAGQQRSYDYTKKIQDPVLGQCEQDKSLYTYSRHGRVVFLYASQLSAC